MKWLKKHKVFTAIVLVILLLIGTAVGYIWSKLRLIQYVDKDDTGPNYQEHAGETIAPEEENEQLIDISGLELSETLPVIPDAEIQESDDIVNIMLLGTDERTTKLNSFARSDSMILVSINKTDKTVKLVSLERGMGVPVLEGQYEGKYDWLTHIFQYGGGALLCKTVEHCFRVEVDYYVRVNFTTVTTVVDAIGGIDIELSAGEAGALNRSNEAVGRLVEARLQPGVNHLDGQSALMLARLRSIDSDWQRVERQRRVILAAVDELKGSSLKELNHLLDQVLPLIETDMSMLEIADLMLYSPNFLASSFEQMTIPKEGTYGGMIGMGGRTLYSVDFETNSEILKEFLYESGTEETTTPAE